MKLRVQVNSALAVVMLGGVLTACESEYDPTVTDANQPVTENPQRTTNDVTENTDAASERAGIYNNTANENLENNSGTNTNTYDEEYRITDERDGTPDTGSWDDSIEAENTQASDMQTENIETDENQEDSISGIYDDVQSDVAAKEQQAVQFEFNSSELTSEAKSKLDDFVLSMKEVDPQEAELLIKGYTDTQGSEEYNQALAGRRAETVKDYLQEQGLTLENLKTEAIGEAPSESVASTIQDNRRVVVEMVVPYAEELTAN